MRACVLCGGVSVHACSARGCETHIVGVITFIIRQNSTQVEGRGCNIKVKRVSAV